MLQAYAGKEVGCGVQPQASWSGLNPTSHGEVRLTVDVNLRPDPAVVGRLGEHRSLAGFR